MPNYEQDREDPDALSLDTANFASGSLPQRSFVRPGRLFTAEETIVLHTAGVLRPESTERIIAKIIEILTR